MGLVSREILKAGERLRPDHELGEVRIKIGALIDFGRSIAAPIDATTRRTCAAFAAFAASARRTEGLST